MARCAGALPDRAAPFRASRLLAPPPLPDVERREPRPAAAPPPDDHRSRAPSKRSPGRRARFSYIDEVAAAPATLAVELAVLAYRLGHLDTAHDRFRVKVARPTERAIQQWRHLPVRGLQKSKQLLRREWASPACSLPRQLSRTLFRARRRAAAALRKATADGGKKTAFPTWPTSFPLGPRATVRCAHSEIDQHEAAEAVGRGASCLPASRCSLRRAAARAATSDAGMAVVTSRGEA